MKKTLLAAAIALAMGSAFAQETPPPNVNQAGPGAQANDNSTASQDSSQANATWAPETPRFSATEMTTSMVS